jgi:hypothetical protein
MVDNKPEHSAIPPDDSRLEVDTPAVDRQPREQPTVAPVPDRPADAFSDATNRAAPSHERPRASMMSSTVLPALSGAVAAAIVVAAAWIAAAPLLEPPPPPVVDTRAIDALTARVAGVESKAANPPAAAPNPAVVQRLDALEKSLATLRETVAARAAAPQPVATADPAITAKVAGLEKSIAELRGELTATTGQSQQLEGAITALKSVSSEAVAPDLAALGERLNQIERAPKPAPVDIRPLRQLVAATLLDLSVSHGEPYAAALDAARPGTADGPGLKALETFAASGVPSAPILARELMALLPQLSPTTGASAAAPGILDRLQAGAEGLIKIQRTDGVPGTDRAAIVSRVIAAAQRNDIAAAKRELEALSPADRAPAQPWIDKVTARETALAASRQLASAALAALPKAQ